jgi:hypothetical protein
VKEGSGKGASLSAGALLGEPGGGAPLLGIQKDMGRRAQGIGITLRGASAGDPGRVLVNRGLVRLWRRTSLSTGAPLGNLEGSSYTGDFERWMKEGSRDRASFSEGAL